MTPLGGVVNYWSVPVALLGACVLWPSVLCGQASFRRVADYAVETSGVPHVLERMDGGLLVTDPLEKVLRLVTSPADSGRRLLRIGDGPGEYRALSGLVPTRGDSTLLHDGQTGRFIVLTGARPVRTIQRADRPWVGVFERLLAVGDDGTAYGLVGRKVRERLGAYKLSPTDVTFADSMALVALSPGDSRGRELFRLRGGYAPTNFVMKRIRGMNTQYWLVAPFERADLVAVCRDGSVLHASPITAQVKWFEQGKSREVRSPQFVRFPTTARSKQRALVELHGAEYAHHFSPDEYPPWPSHQPAFSATGAWCLPTGQGVLESPEDERGRRRYWLVSRSGDVAGIDKAPNGARIVAVGRGAVYFAHESEDGLFTLSKHTVDVVGSGVRRP